jgi:hypothetical protein
MGNKFSTAVLHLKLVRIIIKISIGSGPIIYQDTQTRYLTGTGMAYTTNKDP